MPLTTATSFLVISLNSLVRPNSRHRETAFLLSQDCPPGSGSSSASHGDSDSYSTTGSHLQEETTIGIVPPTPIRPTAPTRPGSQSHNSALMPVSQTSSDQGGINNPGGAPVAVTTPSPSPSFTPPPGVTVSLPIPFPPPFASMPPTTSPLILPYFSQFSGASTFTFPASNDSVVPVPTSNPVSGRGPQVKTGTVVGIVIGIAIFFGLIWMILLRILKRRRHARNLPRGFAPAVIIVDNNSFRASVTELPNAISTTTTTSATTPGRALSPFSALRISTGRTPSPLPHNPPPPPGLSGTAHLSRWSQPPSSRSSSLSTGGHLASYPTNGEYYHQQESYYRTLAVPNSPTAGGSPVAPEMSVPPGLASYHSPRALRRDYDEEDAGHRDPPPSYGEAF